MCLSLSAIPVLLFGIAVVLSDNLVLHPFHLESPGEAANIYFIRDGNVVLTGDIFVIIVIMSLLSFPASAGVSRWKETKNMLVSFFSL